MPGPIRISGPAVEPLTVAEAKAQVRITNSAEDALIARYITAARIHAENLLERTLVTSQWRLILDAFPDAIRLPYPTIQSVDALRFVDVNGATQTLDPADYIVDTAREPGWIVPADGKSWPETLYRINTVEVEYTAGYGALATDVPEPIRQWIALYVGDMCMTRTRSSEKPVDPQRFADCLLEPYQVYG